jgi:hypothetical protein
MKIAMNRHEAVLTHCYQKQRMSYKNQTVVMDLEKRKAEKIESKNTHSHVIDVSVIFISFLINQLIYHVPIKYVSKVLHLPPVCGALPGIGNQWGHGKVPLPQHDIRMEREVREAKCQALGQDIGTRAPVVQIVTFLKCVSDLAARTTKTYSNKSLSYYVIRHPRLCVSPHKET